MNCVYQIQEVFFLLKSEPRTCMQDAKTTTEFRVLFYVYDRNI